MTTEWKRCSNCHQNKDILNFSLNSKKRPYRRSVCKECLTTINTRYILEKRLEKFPYSLWECPSCDHIQTSRKDKCVKCGELNHDKA